MSECPTALAVRTTYRGSSGQASMQGAVAINNDTTDSPLQNYSVERHNEVKEVRQKARRKAGKKGVP